MRYSIIDKKKGEAHGLDARLHRLVSKGTKMVVNENELLNINADIYLAASMLGGAVMTEIEVFNKLKKDK